MYFNYIGLIKRFWRIDAKNKLSGSETRLYFFLLNQFNEEGEKDDWPETLNMIDGTLCLAIGMSPGTLRPCRDKLEKVELIQVKTTGKGYRVGAEYRLLDGSNSSKRSSKNDELPEKDSQQDTQNLTNSDEEPPEVSQQDTQNLTNSDEEPPEVSQSVRQNLTNSDEDSQQDSQRVRQSVTQSVSQNLTNSLYIEESKPQTPNSKPQTQKEGVWGRENDLDFDSKKNGTGPVRRDPFTFKTDSEKTNVPFTQWFDAYQKNVGKDLCRSVWLEMSDEERETAMKHTPPYVLSRPDKAKRKDPFNYLTLKTFNDEIIDRHEYSKNSKRSGSRIPIREESTGDLRNGFNRRRSSHD